MGYTSRFAGRDLLANRLLPLEEKGQPYHLIGHSHGGSVIWEAIQSAVENGIDLTYLKSWSTVGTPFIHYRGKIDWLGIIAWIIATPVLLACALWTFALTFPVLIIFSEEDISFMSGIWAVLALPSHPWFLAIVLFGLGSSLLGTINPFLIGPFRLLRTKRKLQNKAMAQYGGRWFGLWSRHDEAINALAMTPQTYRPRHAIVPRLSHRRQQDQAAVLAAIAKASGNARSPASKALRLALIDPTRWNIWFKIIFAPWVILLGLGKKSHDLTVAPMIDRIVWSAIAKGAQGNDLAFSQAGIVSEIGPCPLPGKENAAHCLSLPDWLDESLLNQTELASQELVGKVRRVLGQIAIAGAEIPTRSFDLQGALTWHELVHTSYFDNQSCRELLALHIEMNGDVPASLLGETDMRVLKGWLHEWKQQVTDSIVNRSGRT